MLKRSKPTPARHVFKEDELLWLKANASEGWPRQQAEYIADEGRGCHMVSVLPEYRSGRSDDGLREVTSDQIEWPKPKEKARAKKN